jgi:hypothetical protein
MKKTIMLATVIVASLSLTACFKSPTDQIGEKIGETMVEKAIESQTGGKVDVDTDKGSVNFKSEDGNTQVSTGGEINLPEGFPKELIVAKDAKITVASEVEKNFTVAYSTEMGKADLAGAYKKDLVEAGWKKTMETMTDTIDMLAFEKDGKKFSVFASDNQDSSSAGKTSVSITLSVE